MVGRSRVETRSCIFVERLNCLALYPRSLFIFSHCRPSKDFAVHHRRSVSRCPHPMCGSSPQHSCSLFLSANGPAYKYGERWVFVPSHRRFCLIHITLPTQPILSSRAPSIRTRHSTLEDTHHTQSVQIRAGDSTGDARSPHHIPSHDAHHLARILGNIFKHGTQTAAKQVLRAAWGVVLARGGRLRPWLARDISASPRVYRWRSAGS